MPPKRIRSPFPALRPCACLLLAAPLLVLGSGTRIGFKDAEATGRGNAFAATADNPSAVYYNPAGLTQIDGEAFSFTGYDIQLESDYKSASGGSARMKREFNLVPQFYCAWSPHGKPYAFGLGVYAPFGLSSKWAGNSPLSTLATKAEQKTSDIAGVVAYEIAPGLSIGGGPVFHHAETNLRRNVSPVNEYSFDGAGNALGFNAGIRWQPSAQHSFGISYQHHYTVDLKGTTGISGLVPTQAASADFVFPEVIIAGYSYRPSPGWNLEVNIDWTNWDRLNSLTVQSSAPLGLSQALNWQSSFFYDFGVTRTFSNGFSLSAGYTYSENSVPNSTYTPAVPDTNRSIFSLGAGYHKDRVSLHLTYQYSYSPDRTVAGSPAPAPGSFPAGQTADGTYRNRYNAISASIGYSF